MPTAADVLRAKSYQETYHVTPDSTVFDAIRLMADKGIGALIVLQDGKLAGMFSERDYTRKIALMDRSSRNTTVADIMTTVLTTVTPTTSIEACLHLMTDKHIRHLPIVEDDQLLGMLSIGDLVKTMINEQQKMIEQLQSYITG
ncbi:MAG: CBS domain-containing protein [Pseudomonadota bacterium]|nr:CBS domain-containing protein [Pseudomonadota bacterium]